MRVAAIVPTLNEEPRIAGLIGALRALGSDTEVIVSDGGSKDGTLTIARGLADQVVRGPAGRGGQLNRGAQAASAPLLFFIHADSEFTAEARAALMGWLDDPRSAKGAATFQFALAARGSRWRAVEWGQRLRHRLTGVAFGDQGLILPRALFERLGGYPDVPIMEDATFHRAVRRAASIHTLAAPLPTSARRFERQGWIRSVARNQLLWALHAFGADPQRLAQAYRPEGPGTPSPSAPHRAGSGLMIFAKAPRPGRVKTRLAASVGDEAAVEIYRALGSTVVENVIGGAYQTCVCFDPPDALAEVRSWLGEDVAYRPQTSGDLGDRMSEAIRYGLSAMDRVCVVGTDAPDVDRALVESALAALDHSDLVLGPAADGGYYLIAVKAPQPQLFRGIPWSSDSVLTDTLDVADRSGLVVHLLRELSDVDHVEDVPTAWRSLLNR